GALSLHTLQVDAANTFTLNGGTFTFNTASLMPSSTTPGKMMIGGDINLTAFTNGIAVVTNGVGAGTTGSIDLGASSRNLTVSNGLDLSFEVPVANGALTKSGQGTLRLNKPNTYTG